MPPVAGYSKTEKRTRTDKTVRFWFIFFGGKITAIETGRQGIDLAQEVLPMISVILLLINTLCVPLRLGSGGSFPRPLKAEEEREYLARFAAGDLEARNKLVEHNLRLVSHILKKYYVQAGDQDDLISIGTIGLIKGISTFKPDKKVRLATYASRCIENAILS